VESNANVVGLSDLRIDHSLSVNMGWAFAQLTAKAKQNIDVSMYAILLDCQSS